MSKLLAALSLGLLLAPRPASAQDEPPPEMKWRLEVEDKFDFKWSCTEIRRREPGSGPPTETQEKRDVEAELVCKEPGILIFTLKKVVWSQIHPDFDLVLTYAEGKKVDVKPRLRADPKSDSYELAQSNADRTADVMKTAIEGEYAIHTTTRRGETSVTRNGIPARGGLPTLFDKLYTHPPLPSGSVKKDQSWKDPMVSSLIPPGTIDVKVIEHKITAVGTGGVVAKGGWSAPLIVSAGVTDRPVSGGVTYAREWSFSRQEYLQSSKEDMTFTRKVDAKGANASFYKENSTHTFKSALTIKKKAPPPPPKDPAEKK